MATSTSCLLEQTFGRVPYMMMAATPPLSLAARAVYAAISWHGRTAYPSDATIAKMAACSPRAARAARTELEERGFIVRVEGQQEPHPGKAVEYVVDDQPPALTWTPLKDGHTRRYERETSARGAYVKAIQAGTSAGGAYPHRHVVPTNKLLLTEQKSNNKNAAPDAASPLPASAGLEEPPDFPEPPAAPAAADTAKQEAYREARAFVAEFYHDVRQAGGKIVECWPRDIAVAKRLLKTFGPVDLRRIGADFFQYREAKGMPLTMLYLAKTAELIYHQLSKREEDRRAGHSGRGSI